MLLTPNIVSVTMQIGYRHIDCAQIYGNEKEVTPIIILCFVDVGFKWSDDLKFNTFVELLGFKARKLGSWLWFVQIGLVLKKLFDDGVVKREEIFITSKLW